MATRSHDIKTQIILKNSSNYVGILNSSRQQCLRSMKENTAKEVLLLGKRKQFFIISPHKTLNLTVWESRIVPASSLWETKKNSPTSSGINVWTGKNLAAINQMSDHKSYWLTSFSDVLKWRLTPGAFICDCGLDIDRYSWESSNGDGEDETHRQSHHPDLITRAQDKDHPSYLDRFNLSHAGRRWDKHPRYTSTVISRLI